MTNARLDTVDRIVEVLDYLMASTGDVSISDLSRNLGYSKSVIHRLLTSLRHHGYVDVDANTRKYRLGFKAMKLGLSALSKVDIRRHALTRMERIRNRSQETVNLSIRVQDRRVYIETLESPREVRQRVELGREMSLCHGGSSKAILAFLPEEDQSRIIDEAVRTPGLTRVPVDADELRRDLASIRQRGYAFTVMERTPDAFSIAVPIFDHIGAVVASVSISGPAYRWKEEYLENYAATLLTEAGELSRELGHHMVTATGGAHLSE